MKQGLLAFLAATVILAACTPTATASTLAASDVAPTPNTGASGK